MDFLEIEEYAPEQKFKNTVFINKSHISYLSQTGLYTSIVLSCGKEIKTAQNVHSLLELCKKKK